MMRKAAESGAAEAIETTRSSDLVEYIIRQIDNMIGKGQLHPGDSVSEPELCAALGVGRVPVREAIRILAGEGLMELIPNKSARIRKVNPTQILEMMEVLTGLAVTAMRRLVRQADIDDVIGDLAAAAERIAEVAATRDAIQIMREVSIFHSILFHACGNEYLLQITKKTRIKYYTRSLIAILGPRVFVENAPHFRRIVDALSRRDAATAGRILSRLVERIQEHAIIPEPLQPARPRGPAKHAAE